MTCQFTLNKAHADQAVIATVRENFRSHLLMALSEARAATISLEPDLRDALLDDLTHYFHPDSDIRDTFSDAFLAAEHLAADRIEEVSNEMALDRRTPVFAQAAE